MNWSKVLFLEAILVSVCLCEIILDKDKFTNAFVEQLNNEAEQQVAYGEPVVTRIEKISEKEHYIEATVRVSDFNNLSIIKYLNCSGVATDSGDSVVIRNTRCADFVDAWTDNIEEPVTDLTTGDATKYTSDGPMASGSDTDSNKELAPDLTTGVDTGYTTGDTTGDGPIQLENEIQPSNMYTSGEQFIAIPREHPAPCAGCASLVDPTAAGVNDLAILGVRQLDRHEPNTRHSLNNVLLVERQVQVVGGVRYTITLNVDYDNCTAHDTDDCTFQKTCKVAVLEKPWKKLADGSKFRAILSNNCTKDWLFYDNSSASTDDHSPANDFGKPSSTPSSDSVLPTDSNIKLVEKSEVFAQPTVENIFTEDQMRELEEQIIPLNKFSKPATLNKNVDVQSEVTDESNLTANRVSNIKTNYEPSSQPRIEREETVLEEGLSADKKKAVDELMNFFDFAGVKPTNSAKEDKTRTKRDYGKDLDALLLAENYQNMRTKLKNAVFIYKMAQVMVDYLNEMDVEVKNRILKSVTKAEEEFENDQQYYYIQADVTMPCNNVECKLKDKVVKTCSGIIDVAQAEPSVLYAVCYEAQKTNKVKFQSVQNNDPILLKLLYEALRGVERESNVPHPLRMKKILRASTQKASGFFTKVTVEIEYVDCNSSVPLFKRSNCSALERLGSLVCDFKIHVKNNWDEKRISHVCVNRPIGESFTDLSYQYITDNSSNSFKDPQILEIVQQALQYLEVKSNRNNKQKLVKITSVSKQSVAGLLTSVEFLVGYTVCKNEYKEDLSNCKLLSNEPLRNCTAEVWERPWLNDENQVKVDCLDILKENALINNKISQQRKKRSLDLVGGQKEVDVNDSQYQNFAEESLQKFILTTGTTQHYKVTKIHKVTVQVVSGKLTKIYFDIAPTNCKVDARGHPTSASCDFQVNPENINCHSSIWERSWLKNKQIDIECNVGNKKARRKRHIQGPEKEVKEDPHDSKFIILAQSALQQYHLNYEISQYYLVEYIEEVSKVEAPGEFFKIDFVAVPTNCTSSEAKLNPSICVKQKFEIVINCHLEHWVKPRFNNTVVNINCQVNDKKLRSKRQLGVATEQSVTAAKYRTLAEEAVARYVSTVGSSQHYKVTKIYKVTTQVVSGTLTAIDFKIAPTTCQVDHEGHPSSSDCRIQNVSGILKCHADIWQQPWLSKKEITVKCSPVKRRFTRDIFQRMTEIPNKSRLKRQIPGGYKSQDVCDPKYFKLSEESLAKYVLSSAIKQHHVPIEIVKVVTQTVSGLLTKIDFKASATTCEVDSNGQPTSTVCEVQNPQNVLICHSDIWEQRWINKKEFNVNCSSYETRKKRDIAVGERTQDPSNLKFIELAEQSLDTYMQMSRLNKQEHKLLKIERVTTQLVSGQLTKLDFTILPTKCLNKKSNTYSESNCHILYCHSLVWERSWIKNHNKSIEVTCDEIVSLNDNLNFYNVENIDNSLLNETIFLAENRDRRSSFRSGGDQEQNPNNPQYKRLALESLKKYQRFKKTQYSYKVIEMNRVITRVVSGIIYKIDYIAAQTTCPRNVSKLNFDLCELVENTTLICHTEIWDRPWLKRKRVDVYCGTNEDNYVYNEESSKSRKRRSILTTKKLLTNNASNRQHELSAFDNPELNVTNGVLEYDGNNLHLNNTIDVTSNELEQNNNRQNISPITTQEQIKETFEPDRSKVLSIGPDTQNEFSDFDISGLNKSNAVNKFEAVGNYLNNTISLDFNTKNQNNKSRPHYVQKFFNRYNDPYYTKLANEALEKYQNITNAKNIFKLIEIHYASERTDGGLVVSLDFTAAPTTCLTDQKNKTNCKNLKPTLSCHADVHIILVLDNNVVKQSKIDCKEPRRKRRSRRQIDQIEDYVEDELKYFYTDRVVNKFNQEDRQPNLHKLISIYDVRRTTHMKVNMVRMFIELAKTYCTRDSDERVLAKCTEMDGIDHKVCLGRVWPSRYDDYVLDNIHIVCDIDPEFKHYAGYTPYELVTSSLDFINNQNVFPNFVVPALEKHFFPTFDYKTPTVLLFAVMDTNCTREESLQPNAYCVPLSSNLISCRSEIYFIPNQRDIDFLNVSCVPFGRTKRSISKAENSTDQDVEIQKLVQESLEKLEIQSVHNYKQRVLLINSYSIKVGNGKETSIDFDVGYTNCLKYEWVDNITKCEFLEHLPRRHCVSHVTERLFLDNGRGIEVACADDETPLEANMEFESAEGATSLANEALKHIEYKYPHPKRLKVLRIFTLEKQVAAGIHYRMKLEVGYTNCMALSEEENCYLDPVSGTNQFCRVNVWVRPWTNHPPSYRVSCDYTDSSSEEIYREMQAEELFQHFLQTHRPPYLSDVNKMRERFSIFKENLNKIHELNVYEMGTARYAVTRFADLSAEEFRELWGGWKESLRDENQVPMPPAEIPAGPLPDAFDWRDHDAVTDVKDQGMCGSCWAFSVTGNIEGQWKKHSGKLVSLSEQELVDCDTLDQGCNGGLPDNAYRAIEQLGGLELESDYPYEGDQEKCDYNATLARVQISGAVNISSNETDMAKWLVANGPISIGINANAMQFYVGGISHPWRMLCSPKKLDHGVLIVGYGEKDYPLFNKKLPYWIIKNSWGRSWGEQGYYRVYRGDGTCGVNQMASSAVV